MSPLTEDEIDPHLPNIPYGNLTFRTMLWHQSQFQELLARTGKLPARLGEMTTEQRVAYIKDALFALDHEGHELIENMSWKHWASGERFDRQACIEELVDLYAFLFNITLAIGFFHDEIHGDDWQDDHEAPIPHTITSIAEEVGRHVWEKVEKNFERQQRPEGYKGVGGV